MQNDDTTHFTGLASPAAAASVATLVWMSQTHGWSGPALDWVHALSLTALGFLMISRFPYSSFKSVSFDRRVPFVRMLLVVAVVALIASGSAARDLAAVGGVCPVGPVAASSACRYPAQPGGRSEP